MRRALVLGLLLFVAPVAAYADAIIVMIAATPTGDGVLSLPVGGDAAFAVAAINVGSSGVGVLPFAELGVNGQRLPGEFPPLVCETDRATGQCLAVPRSEVFQPGEIRTYSVFLHAIGAVPFNPSTTRLVVGLAAYTGRIGPGPILAATYAATTVAVRTVP
jgi:hypothetical protein